MHIHILGICGTAMGGIALLAKAAGHIVTGCDTGVYPPMSTQLQEQGIALIEGFDTNQIHSDIDLYVIGNALSRGNALVEAILNQGLPYTSGAQWLSDYILRNRWVLAVAGTHGKTTTSAILAWILEHAGYNPSFLIGGVPHNFGVSSRLTDSTFFVIEADEYDTAFFDKRSKFVHYRPNTAILNNLEFDHADIFPNIEAIETQFHHLVRTIPSQGAVVINTSNTQPHLQTVLNRGCWSSVISFNTDHSYNNKDNTNNNTKTSDWHVGQVFDEGQYEVYYQGVFQGIVNSTLTGEHNRSNVLAAIAAAKHVGISPAISIEAMTTFESVKRRMELKGTVNGISVIDDFAHHPTAIATTLAGLRQHLNQQCHKQTNTHSLMQTPRILAVLEPRSNTMKLGVMKQALPDSLKDADYIFGYGEASGKNALGWDLTEALTPLGNKAIAYSDLPLLIEAIVNIAREGDTIICMSNGGFGGIHERLLTALKKAHQ